MCFQQYFMLAENPVSRPFSTLNSDFSPKGIRHTDSIRSGGVLPQPQRTEWIITGIKIKKMFLFMSDKIHFTPEKSKSVHLTKLKSGYIIENQCALYMCARSSVGRASDSSSLGPRFESVRAHHFFCPNSEPEITAACAVPVW